MQPECGPTRFDPSSSRPSACLLPSDGIRGVAEILGVRFSGIIAWGLWRTIYLSKLPRFEKKLRVALQWLLDVVFECGRFIALPLMCIALAGIFGGMIWSRRRPDHPDGAPSMHGLGGYAHS